MVAKKRKPYVPYIGTGGDPGELKRILDNPEYYNLIKLEGLPDTSFFIPPYYKIAHEYNDGVHYIELISPESIKENKKKLSTKLITFIRRLLR